MPITNFLQMIHCEEYDLAMSRLQTFYDEHQQIDHGQEAPLDYALTTFAENHVEHPPPIPKPSSTPLAKNNLLGSPLKPLGIFDYQDCHKGDPLFHLFVPHLITFFNETHPEFSTVGAGDKVIHFNGICKDLIKLSPLDICIAACQDPI
jgi:hypothetical protein